MMDNSGFETVRRWYRSATVRRLELVALSSTALAFALTVVLAGSAHAVESNPLALALLGALGWVGAGSLALVLEGVIFEAYRRLERSHELAARVGAGLVAAIGVADVLVNVWVLSVTGLPETLSGRLLGAIAIVTLVAIGVAFREVLVETLRYQRSEIGVVCRTAAVITLVLTVALSGVAPFTGPLSYSENVSAGPTDGKTLYVNDGDAVVAFNQSGGELWRTTIASTENVRGIGTGPDGGVYASTGGGTVKKLAASDGSTEWTYTSGRSYRKLAIDGDGNVYVGSYSGNVVKIDSSGSEVWVNSYSSGDIWDVAITSDGNIAISNEDPSVEKIDPDGSVIWSESLSDNGKSVAATENGIYAGDQAGNVVKIDSSGSTVWTHSTGWSYVNSVEEQDGTVIGGGSAGTVLSLSDDGSSVSENWESGSFASYLWGADIDADGNIYGVGGGTVGKFLPDGTQDYTNTALTSDGYALESAPLPTISSSPSSTYEQTFELEDQTGLFPAERSSITVYERVGSADFDSYERVGSKVFNSEDRASFDLKNQSSYRVTVEQGGNVWELYGYVADDRDGLDELTIETAIDTTEPTPTPAGTPTPTRTPGATPFPTSSSTPTPTSDLEATGPTYIGECSEPGVSSGISVEYWDPTYETASFDYSIENDSGVLFEGTKTFEEPIGYYRGCIGENVTGVTNPSEDNTTVDYSGGYENGTGFSGTIDWSDAIASSSGGGFGGPVGSGADSPAATWLGWLLLVGGGYVAYRRYGDGQLDGTISSVGSSASSAARSVGRSARRLFGR